MTEDPRQPTFSEVFPAVFSIDIRDRKAQTIEAVLREFLDRPRGRLLDIGSSSGAISHRMAGLFDQVVGVDVDRHALRFAAQHFKKVNLAFGLVDGTQLPFKDMQFDVVVCTHIYEHVADPKKLLVEIRRVLKCGGTCYFVAANRLWPMEFHYRLPFLAWLPASIANRYIKLCGKGNLYDVRLLTLGSLRRLVEDFSVVDFTRPIVERPAAYHAEYMLPPGSMTHRLARLVLKYCYWLFPTYIWLLIRR
jgi:ubiquinone/menaquinone biosynthesis C-methylase UbiE